MSTQWKPGDVAMVTVENYASSEQLVGLCHQGGINDRGTGDGTAKWYLADGTEVWSSVSTVRPLVVIDPEDREAVERLYRTYVTTAAVNRVDAMQAALREFANPKPPKPDEPTGLGAVVEDAEGCVFIRHQPQDEDDNQPWFDDTGDFYSWTQVSAVRVLSEGVQS